MTIDFKIRPLKLYIHHRLGGRALSQYQLGNWCLTVFWKTDLYTAHVKLMHEDGRPERVIKKGKRR